MKKVYLEHGTDIDVLFGGSHDVHIFHFDMDNMCIGDSFDWRPYILCCYNMDSESFGDGSTINN
jgi:hypothetical protein